MAYRIAIVGASGLVGRTMATNLEEFHIPVSELVLYSSKNSAGKSTNCFAREYQFIELTDAKIQNFDFALFSAGSFVSKHFAAKFVEKGAIVIDNGSYWRLFPDVPLVVPEVNLDSLKNHRGVIANPNCSTIQLVVALKPLVDAFGVNKVSVATYQSISGAGQKAIDCLFNEMKTGATNQSISKHPFAFNTVFHSIENDNGYSVEELKMIYETQKILDIQDLPISVTCVRLPIIGGHGEAVSVELLKDFSIEEIQYLFSNSAGIVLIDNPKNQEFPTVKISENRNEVFVGRFRKDLFNPKLLHFWITADNVRKGAATNAVQILNAIIHNKLS